MSLEEGEVALAWETSFYGRGVWNLGVEYGETSRGHSRKGAKALIGTEEAMAVCLGDTKPRHLACRKVAVVNLGSVYGPELRLKDFGLGAAALGVGGIC